MFLIVLLLLLCSLCRNMGYSFIQQEISWNNYKEGLKCLHELQLDKARTFFMRSYSLFPNLHSILLAFSIDNLSGRGYHFDYLYDERVIEKKKELQLAFEYLQRGISLHQDAQYASAIKEYSQGLEYNKYEAELWFHLGVSFTSLGQVVEAVQSYLKALHYNPIHIKSLLNMGSIFHQLGDLQQAMKAYERVVAVFDSSRTMREANFVPIDYLRVQGNIVLIWYQIGEISKALNTSRSVLSNLSGISEAYVDGTDMHVVTELRDSFLAHTLTMQRSVALWRNTETLLHRLVSSTLNNAARNKRGPLLAFDTLLYDISLQQRLAVSQATCRKHPSHINAVVHKAHKEDISLVVGFVTADIGNHPTGVLLEGLLRLLRLNVEYGGQSITTIVFNIGPISNSSATRRSIIAAADYFYDLPLTASMQVKLKLLYGSHSLEVLLDMQVHTQASQMELIAAHPPQVIAVNYLVYPATSGCGFMNYLLADSVVTPPEHSRQYAERLVLLPPTYQVAYYREYSFVPLGQDAMGESPLALEDVLEIKYRIRRQLGIPQDAVVLCNFNKLDKIDLVSFQVWMQIMVRVPNAILWLLRPSPVMQDDEMSNPNAANMSDYAESQLRASLAYYGIDGSRLIFANRTSKHAHIHRHLAADLFVDTFTYSAHSTATDALFGGLPLLTIHGDAFTNKVGASLISGLLQGSENDFLESASLLLIAHSKKEFENMAIDLLRNRSMLHGLQSSLLNHLRLHYSIQSGHNGKDIRYARHFIAALQAMKETQNISNSNTKYVSSLFHLHIVSKW